MVISYSYANSPNIKFMLKMFIFGASSRLKLVRRSVNLLDWLNTNSNTLQLSAFSRCYCLAEYSCQVWQCNPVSTQLHSSVHLISGTIWSASVPWLPVLSNIKPPALQHTATTSKLIIQAECCHDWPLYGDIFHSPSLHLKFHMLRHTTSWCHKSVVWWLTVDYSGQLCLTSGPRNLTPFLMCVNGHG